MELKPLENKSRIEAVDALRGFALLGIIIANIPFANENMVSGKLDSLMTFLFHFLIAQKFISIFSILFGFGFYIQLKRAEAKGVHFTSYFTIRMLLLFAIGSLHAFVIWNGDILRAYALGGILLLFVRNWSVKRLLIIALLFAIFITGIVYIGNSAYGWRMYNYDYALANELPLTTSYFRYLTINAIMDPWVNFTKDLPITLAFTIGNILIGFILAKVDFFNLPQKWNRLTTFLIIQGSTLGLGASYIFYKISIGEIIFNLSMLWIPFVVLTGILLQSLMYISLFLRLFQVESVKTLFRLFALVGKTSLSNYILQSVFYLFAFYHCTHTFQLFGKLTIAETYLVGILFFIIQTVLSYLWLKNHNQGPLESIWKGISYRMTLPFKNTKIESSLVASMFFPFAINSTNDSLSIYYSKVKRFEILSRTYFIFKKGSTFCIRSIGNSIYSNFEFENIKQTKCN